MKNFSKLILLISIVSFLSCENVKKKIERADRLSEEGKFQESIKLRNEILEKETNNIGEYINRGADKSSLGKYEEAIQDYKKALKLDTTSTLALLNIGNNFKRLNKNEIAIEYYSKALLLAQEPKLKITYVKNDLFDFTYLNKPSYEAEKNDILFERGLAYIKTGNYQNAINDLEEITINVELGKEEVYGLTLYWVGYCYSKLNNKVKACENLEKALKANIIVTKEEIYEKCD